MPISPIYQVKLRNNVVDAIFDIGPAMRGYSSTFRPETLSKLKIPTQGWLHYIPLVLLIVLKNSTEMFHLTLLRGTVLNRTYGTHKNLYIDLFLLSTFLALFTMAPRNRDFHILMWDDMNGRFRRIVCGTKGRFVVPATWWILTCMLRHGLSLDSSDIIYKRSSVLLSRVNHTFPY